MLASTSVCFDLSVFELFVPLVCGGKVILARDVLEVSELPAASEVRLVNTVPSAMAQVLRMGGAVGWCPDGEFSGGAFGDGSGGGDIGSRECGAGF